MKTPWISLKPDHFVYFRNIKSMFFVNKRQNESFECILMSLKYQKIKEHLKKKNSNAITIVFK